MLIKTALALLAAGSAMQGAVAGINLRSWDEAHELAKAVTDKMSLEQWVNITTGTGWMKSECVGNTRPTKDPDFPSLCLEDGPPGIRFANNVTAFGSGITAAGSFDKDQIRKRGEAMGKEFRGKGVHFALGPCVDIMRAPQTGRGWEGFGEDPYLAGVAGSLTVEGIQSQGVIATAKHYIGNNQETNRKNSTSNIGKRALHEIWTWPYARMVEAGIGAIMCSYNQLNGTWGCEDDYTLNTVLKKEYNFRGLVMSDWGATHSTAPAINGGLDMTMPGDLEMGDNYTYFGVNMTKAVRDGEVSEERAQDMATRIIAAYYKLGQDEGFPEVAIRAFQLDEAPYVPVQEDHGKLVREMGAAATALLKNDDKILPITSSVKKIAVIGSDAGPNPDGLYDSNCVDQGCAKGTTAMGWGSGTVQFPYLVTPLDGITSRAGEEVEVVHTFDDWDEEGAAELAKDADIALVFSMTKAGEEYMMVDGNHDRKNLSLWNNGDNLIRAVADANGNTVVVIHSVGPVDMPWIDHPNIKAIVWPHLPGQETGNSLADVLFGDVNPSGRLPYTIGKSADDYAAGISHDFTIEYTEGLNTGYRHFDANDIEPLFPFGHGLSYTTFEYSKLKVKKGSKKDGSLIRATVYVRNTGDVDGAEIPQAYISFPESAGEPPKVLRGFEKVFLKAGKHAKVEFNFGETELSIWDPESEAWTVPSGEYTLHIGASSRDIRQSAKFNL